MEVKTHTMRRESVTAQERMDRLKRYARAVTDLERAQREYNAALVQAWEAGISSTRLAKFGKVNKSTILHRIKRMPGREG
jgi:hypothetical protein